MAFGVWFASLALALALAILPGRAVRMARDLSRNGDQRSALPVMLGAAAVDVFVAILAVILSLSIAATWPGAFQLLKLSAAALVLAPAWLFLFPMRDAPPQPSPAHNPAGAGALARAGDIFAITMLATIAPLASDADRPALTQVMLIGASVVVGALTATGLALRLPAEGKRARLVRAANRPAMIVIAMACLYSLIATWGR